MTHSSHAPVSRKKPLGNIYTQSAYRRIRMLHERVRTHVREYALRRHARQPLRQNVVPICRVLKAPYISGRGLKVTRKICSLFLAKPQSIRVNPSHIKIRFYCFQPQRALERHPLPFYSSLRPKDQETFFFRKRNNLKSPSGTV